MLKKNKENTLEIWTDGACQGNPGEGAFGIVLKYGQHTKEINGYIPHTTNNQMELLAVIVALSSLSRECQIILHTDSIYVKDGITKWIMTWKENNWKTANKTPVKNKLLWQKLDAEVQNHTIEFKWVKGHAGLQENERADALCNEAIKNKSPILPKYNYLLQQ